MIVYQSLLYHFIFSNVNNFSRIGVRDFGESQYVFFNNNRARIYLPERPVSKR